MQHPAESQLLIVIVSHRILIDFQNQDVGNMNIGAMIIFFNKSRMIMNCQNNYVHASRYYSGSAYLYNINTVYKEERKRI